MTTGEETTIKTIETKNVNSIVDDEPLPIIDNTTKDIEAANINEKVIDMTDIKSSEGVVGAGGGGEKESNWRADQVHVLPTNNLPLVFSGLMLATFLAALDQTIVATSLPSIIRELGDGSPAAYSAYSWIGVAYLLTATAFSPFYGKLSVVFGRKPLLYFSIVCFLVGSALCGASKVGYRDCVYFFLREESYTYVASTFFSQYIDYINALYIKRCTRYWRWWNSSTYSNCHLVRSLFLSYHRVFFFLRILTYILDDVVISFLLPPEVNGQVLWDQFGVLHRF